MPPLPGPIIKEGKRALNEPCHHPLSSEVVSIIGGHTFSPKTLSMRNLLWRKKTPLSRLKLHFPFLFQKVKPFQNKKGKKHPFFLTKKCLDIFFLGG
jgi:hypothetical protein